MKANFASDVGPRIDSWRALDCSRGEKMKSVRSLYMWVINLNHEDRAPMIHLSKAILPNVTMLGAKASTYEFRGHKYLLYQRERERISFYV